MRWDEATASLQLEATEQGGQAQLAVRDGSVELPGLFEDPVLPITELSTRLHWRLPQPGDKQGAYEFALQDLRLQTPDARGEFELRWHRARDATGPGTIDLSGQLDGLAATRVARYMPMSLPATRSYLSRALLAGDADGVSVRLKGPLAEFPYTAPGSAGVFRVATQARGVSLAYVPPAADGTPSNWPPFERIDGELIFQRDGMQIRNARARMLGYEVSGVNGASLHCPHAAPVLFLRRRRSPGHRARLQRDRPRLLALHSRGVVVGPSAHKRQRPAQRAGLLRARHRTSEAWHTSARQPLTRGLGGHRAARCSHLSRRDHAPHVLRRDARQERELRRGDRLPVADGLAA
jgi:hypothetical protein